MISTRRGFLGSLSAGIALPSLARLEAQTPARASSATVEKNVVFGRAGNVDLHLDVFRPTGPSVKRAAVIHWHGGGFSAGSKDGLAQRLEQVWTALGYVNIAAQYRLSDVAAFPAQIEDCKAAVRWTRANAEKLGIDPRRIATAGYSAGGYLSLLTASTPNRPEFEGTGGNAGVSSDVAICASFYPATGEASWTQWKQRFPMPPGSTDAQWQAAEAGRYVASLPPTILFHGLADTTIRPENSVAFLQQLREAKITSELHTFAGAAHGYDGPDLVLAEASARLFDVFFTRYIDGHKNGSN